MAHPNFDALGGATAAPLAGRSPLTGFVQAPAVGAVRAQEAVVSAATYLAGLTRLVEAHLLGDATYGGADMESLLVDARHRVTDLLRRVESRNDTGA